MPNFIKDPIINIIHNGIKRDIRIALEQECFRAAIILIYSGIDTMAYLNMPSNQDDVVKEDFIYWAERYIHFPCKEQLTGVDLYGARCSMLHHYGSSSRLSREGKCRQIVYFDNNVPEISYNPKISNEIIIVSINGLAKAFFKGVDDFLVNLFADSDKAQIAESRLQKLMQMLPYKEDTDVPHKKN